LRTDEVLLRLLLAAKLNFASFAAESNADSILSNAV